MVDNEIIVDLCYYVDKESLCRFVRNLGPDYYVSEEAIREAVRGWR